MTPPLAVAWPRVPFDTGLADGLDPRLVEPLLFPGEASIPAESHLARFLRPVTVAHVQREPAAHLFDDFALIHAGMGRAPSQAPCLAMIVAIHKVGIVVLC